jgi:hypothetical protein
MEVLAVGPFLRKDQLRTGTRKMPTMGVDMG